MWSRLGNLSLTIVVPLKFKAAKRIALLTWAEPISSEYFKGIEKSSFLEFLLVDYGTGKTFSFEF